MSDARTSETVNKMRAKKMNDIETVKAFIEAVEREFPNWSSGQGGSYSQNARAAIQRLDDRLTQKTAQIDRLQVTVQKSQEGASERH